MYSLYGSFTVDTKDSEVSFDIFNKVKKILNIEINLLSNEINIQDKFLFSFNYTFNKDYKYLLYWLIKESNKISSNWNIETQFENNNSLNREIVSISNYIKLSFNRSEKYNFFDKRIISSTLELFDTNLLDKYEIYLEVFDKNSEELVRLDKVSKNIDLNILKNLFKIKENRYFLLDGLGYDLDSSEKINYLQKFVLNTIDIDNYIYFLSSRYNYN
jgi:hypothetical protein